MADVKRTYIMPEKPKEGPPAISIDDTIKECLICVKRIVDKISSDTARNGPPSRETAAILKDCIMMLFEAKKKEDEIMADLSETELESMLRSKK